MTKTYIVSIFCPDQVGLVSSITGKLFELGANLGDTSFATLGTGSEFSTICSVQDNVSQDTIEKQLFSLEALKDGNIRVEPFTLEPRQPQKSTTNHRIVLRGKDNPGLVARISEVFAKYGANIVQLNSETVSQGTEDQYVVNLIVWIPEESVSECKATIEETADSINMQCNISDV